MVDRDQDPAVSILTEQAGKAGVHRVVTRYCGKAKKKGHTVPRVPLVISSLKMILERKRGVACSGWAAGVCGVGSTGPGKLT